MSDDELRDMLDMLMNNRLVRGSKNLIQIIFVRWVSKLQKLNQPSVAARVRFGMVNLRLKICPRSSREIKDRRMARALSESPFPA